MRRAIVALPAAHAKLAGGARKRRKSFLFLFSKKNIFLTIPNAM
jgi:hypothetical protein